MQTLIARCSVLRHVRDARDYGTKTASYMSRLARHNIVIIAMLIPFGFVIFLTAFNEAIIFEHSNGSAAQILMVWLLSILGIAVVVGGVSWVLLVLVARRTIKFRS